jgi:hypothetical protein
MQIREPNMNKTIVTTVAACAFVVANAAAAGSPPPPPLPYFQQPVPTCNLAKIKGTYSFNSQGNYSGYADALAGYVSFDGLGNVAAFYTTKVQFPPAGNTWSANLAIGNYTIGDPSTPVSPGGDFVPTCRIRLYFCSAVPTANDVSVWDAYFNADDDKSFDFATIYPAALTFAGKAEFASSKNLIPGVVPITCGSLPGVSP